MREQPLTLTRLELQLTHLARAHAGHERTDDAAEAEHLLGGALVGVGAARGVEGALGAGGVRGDTERLHPQERLGLGLGLGLGCG